MPLIRNWKTETKSEATQQNTSFSGLSYNWLCGPHYQTIEDLLYVILQEELGKACGW